MLSKFALFVFAVSLLLTCIILRSLFVTYWRSLLIFRKCKNLKPGPTAYPIIGYPKAVVASPHEIQDYVDEAYDIFGKQTPCPFWLGPSCYIVVNLEQTKELLKNPHLVEKPEIMYKYLRPMLGDGLLTSNVSTWVARRRLLQQAFVPKPINYCIDLVSKYTQILVDEWRTNLNKREFQVYESVCSAVFSPLLVMWFGLEPKDISITPLQFMQKIERLKYIGMKKLMKPWLDNDMLFKLTGLKTEERKEREELRSYAAEIYQASKATMEKLEAQQAEVPSENQIGRFIDILGRKEVLDKYKITHDDIIDEILTAFTGGSDTVSFTMSNILLMLAHHPEKQEKVYQELYEIYGSNSVASMPITADDLPKMKYLECCIKETLRIFPPVPFIGRIPKEDKQIGGATISKGATILMPLAAMNRESTWINPLEFVPERHLSKNSESDPELFLPFGKGARCCPGQKYAYMKLKTSIAIILRHYVIKSDNIVPVKDVKISIALFSEHSKPISIRIEKRL